MLSSKKIEYFKQFLEARIAELESTLDAAERETRVDAARYADPADQAASEYERQAVIHKATTARQMIGVLSQALDRLRQGTFGECASCGGEIEGKRLEAIPWATYCLKCQGAREQGWSHHT